MQEKSCWGWRFDWIDSGTRVCLHPNFQNLECHLICQNARLYSRLERRYLPQIFQTGSKSKDNISMNHARVNYRLSVNYPPQLLFKYGIYLVVLFGTVVELLGQGVQVRATKMGQRSSSLSAPTSHPLLSQPGASPLPQQNIPLATRKVGDPMTPEKRRYPKLRLIYLEIITIITETGRGQQRFPSRTFREVQSC